MTTPTPPLARFTSYTAVAEHGEPDYLVIERELVPLIDDDRPAIDALVELARIDRALRVAEFKERYAVVHLELSKEPWFTRPWARLGAAALVGYAFGRSKTLRVMASLTFGAVLAMAVDRALAHAAPAPAHW